MNELRSLRRRVEALRRKLAIPLAILRLTRLAREFSRQWTVAVADRQSPPESHPFILRVADAGFRLTTFMSVHKYLERCRDQNTLPDSNKMVQSLLPWCSPLVAAQVPDMSPDMSPDMAY